MKNIIFIISGFFTIIIIIVISLSYLNTVCGFMYEYTNTIDKLAVNEDWTEALNEYRKLWDYFKSHKTMLSLILDYQDLRAVENEFNLLQKSLVEKERAMVFESTVRIKNLMEYIPQKDGFSPELIL